MKYHRQSIRLRNYDYGSQGLYYVTICTQNRELYFENNDIKQIIEQYWLKIPEHFNNIELDEWIVMLNHIHGIIIISNVGRRRGEVSSPYQKELTSYNKEGGETPPLQREKYALGQIIAYFKYQSTKEVNKLPNNEPGQKLWQRNYYEHIIRNQKSLNDIRKYIKFNSLNWDRDRNNPKNWMIK